MKNKIMELADDLARAAFNDQMRQEEARAALQAEVARVEQELEAAKADVERMNHLVANVRCSGANIDGQHTWNFLWGKGWTTGASFREAIDNAKKGQPK